MNRQEAIEVLEIMKTIVADSERLKEEGWIPDAINVVIKRQHEALDLAIDALSEPSIVRCGECEYYDTGENESESWSICGHVFKGINTPVDEDDYCSYGEPKEPIAEKERGDWK